MSGIMNIQVVGNVSQAPEMRDIQGTKVANFNVAVNTGYGEKKAVTFFRVAQFGKQAENTVKFLEKGRQVMIAGTLAIREYDKKDGTKGTSYDIKANDIVFLGSKPEEKPATTSGGPDDASVPF